MDNLPANIELHSAATQRSIETVLADQDGVYDVILMDSPVVDSSTRGIPIGPDQRDQLAGCSSVMSASLTRRSARTFIAHFAEPDLFVIVTHENGLLISRMIERSVQVRQKNSASAEPADRPPDFSSRQACRVR
ncbi:hypothetical protein [Mesorhizobium sp.]|uniref:hypothetical protein n=1 Tax=Mesorhizobium sp. TaxID=1871066 RepID=UPI0025C2AF47|nr:hypothetical protein [Mesorhizobium sp.]